MVEEELRLDEVEVEETVVEEDVAVTAGGTDDELEVAVGVVVVEVLLDLLGVVVVAEDWVEVELFVVVVVLVELVEEGVVVEVLLDLVEVIVVVVVEDEVVVVDPSVAAGNSITLLFEKSATQRLPEGSRAIPRGVNRPVWLVPAVPVLNPACPITNEGFSPGSTGAENCSTLL